jgi:large subunit ribosomal protein L25
VKAIQHDPIKGTITHADFWAVKMTQKITTQVPVHFLGDAPGVRTGGVMTHNLQQVHVEALPAGLPDYIDADISTLEVGDSLHVRDLVAPDGVTILDTEDEIVCSVMAPKALEEEAAADGTAEPEVIGEKASDDE